MSITQSILVSTDFSDGAHHGLVKAAELAVEVGAKVTVCHVLDPSPLAPIAARGAAAGQFDDEQDLERAIHDALGDVARKYFADVDEVKTTLIMSPNAAQGICHYASKEDTDLIVISTHGRTGLSQLLIGSVAEKVVRHAPCPVLTVRTPFED